MTRSIGFLLLIFGFTSLCVVQGQEPKGKLPDFKKGFLFGDANKDGKLSKEEFEKLAEKSPRIKEKAEMLPAIFDKLDANKDGSLSLDEFRNLVEGSNLKKGETPTPSPVPAKTEKTATPDQLAFFEKKIRPVLVDKCYSCHSAEKEKIKGGLAVDTKDGLRTGGDTGPAVVPGDTRKSLLLEAIRYKNDSLKMPPKEKLSDAVIADFEKWIAMGAADPRVGTPATKTQHTEIDIEKGRQFWAFQPPKNPTIPKVKNTAWPKTDADRLLLHAMEAKNLKPVGDAEPATLLRRLYFDLIGLPPTPEQVEAYCQTPTAKKLEEIVDQLLASPQFGERWGRHWLDVARYGETSGRSANFNYPHAWRYRDYVIQAFNQDKPYDQFIREQVAGDLLPAKDDQQKAEFLIATGFLAIGPKNHNERNPLQFQLDMVDEQIDTTFQAIQALTVACARCHDHKFDPIPTKDYYALAGIFRSTETCYGTIRTIQSNHPSSLLTLPSKADLPVAVEPLSPERRKELQKQLDDAKKRLSGMKAADSFLTAGGVRLRIQIPTLEAQLANFEADGTPKKLAMGTKDRSRPSDSKIYIRGETDKPGEVAPRGFPQVLTTKQPKIQSGSGRLELANWLASKDNPLTARVLVNRVWLHLFGQGIVATPDNFGASGQAPTNPALLDHLAIQFMNQGWSIKKMIKSIVLSRAYQMSSQGDLANQQIDPENTLFWHMNKSRLEAEAIRDGMLFVSGQLDPKAPKTNIVAQSGEGFTQGIFRFRAPDLSANPYRTVYMPIIRDYLPDVLTLFDFPDPSMVAGERNTTTVPAQSLFLMNNSFVFKQAETIADQLLKQSGSEEDRVQQAYLKLLSRKASTKEVFHATEFLKQYSQQQIKERQRSSTAQRSAWTAFCQALLASAEFAQRN